MPRTVACEACGLIQVVDELPRGALARCARCRLTLQHRKPDSRRRTLALALGAFILYFPANLSPILKAAYLGAYTESKVFDGIHALFQKGNYLVAGLVFTTSIIVPGVKIIGLLLLCLTLRWPQWQQFRTWTYRTIQFCDPWNMLPVTLLAIFVSLAELGEVATVHPGPGVFAFAGMVILLTCADQTFEPQLIWEEAGKRR
ncbi:MAG TPA: paraquat-inducible protein A [Candidatus Sulfotelmatobacter sp.]|nr:paraquat-inducible protein A [Candidatus Sulfotelmatobacter sp.]